MKRILLGLLAATAFSCASPPSEPESLWETLPDSPAGPDEVPPISGDSENGEAKSLPAKPWERESSQPGGTGSGEGEPGPVVTDLRGRVVLNEVHYDAVAGDTDGVVFVELYGEAGLPIGGAKIHFVDGGDGSVDDTITLPENAVLGEDGFYLVADARTGSPTETNVPGADLIDNFDPQNGPDAVQLQDAAGFLVDVLGYGTGLVPLAENGLATFETNPSMDPVGGHSLERRQKGLDTGDNASDFEDREAPTPGA